MAGSRNGRCSKKNLVDWIDVITGNREKKIKSADVDCILCKKIRDTEEQCPTCERRFIQDFYLWKENLKIAEIFLSVITQWRVSGGFLIGLDHTAVDIAVSKWRGITIDSDIADHLMVCEQAYMQAVNPKRKENDNRSPSN